MGPNLLNNVLCCGERYLHSSLSDRTDEIFDRLLYCWPHVRLQLRESLEESDTWVDVNQRTHVGENSADCLILVKSWVLGHYRR